MANVNGCNACLPCDSRISIDECGIYYFCNNLGFIENLLVRQAGELGCFQGSTPDVTNSEGDKNRFKVHAIIFIIEKARCSTHILIAYILNYFMNFSHNGLYFFLLIG